MISIGHTIAHYRVTAKLGAGGMGEVYRATDTKLGRDVAIKVLPEAFAADAQRMQRFQREAQVLASLNHPNIAAIYGLEEAGAAPNLRGSAPTGAVRALVMELVEGLTLAERIALGAIPLDEALPIAKQIAEALEYAHERGIIHRDLKPANIKLTADGQVKVLDFGLAKALEGDSAAENISNSPTLSMAATNAGVILGTAAYMSPEQAKGKAVDRRADTWSFGVVLFEMLTGRKLYSGETASETMAHVITQAPQLDALPEGTPRLLRRLLERCLAKDPRQRLQAIGEARIAIEEAIANPQGASGAMHGAARSAELQAGPPWRRALPWALAGAMTVVAAGAIWGLLRSRIPPSAPPIRVQLQVPLAESFEGGCCGRFIAVSPDSRWLAFVATANQKQQVYLRRLDQPNPVPLPGTENAAALFFSPDSRWLAFFSGGKLKKVPIEGGTPLDVCTTGADPRGGTWASDDTIILAAAGNSGLTRVPASGGTPEPLTQLDKAQEEIWHRWPYVLPKGKAVLFAVQRGGQTYIEAVSLETKERKKLITGGSQPQYAATGHLVYAKFEGQDGGSSLGAILAAPFDPDRIELTGAAVPVIEDALVWTGGAANLVFSADGNLFYISRESSSEDRELVWVDRKGTAVLVTDTRRPFQRPRLTPDGRRFTVGIEENPHGVWIFDLARGTLSRLTFESSDLPLPTPDGKRVVYMSKNGIYWKPLDGTGTEERLLYINRWASPGSWSPDGKTLAYTVKGAGYDIWLLPVAGEGKPQAFAIQPFFELSPEFSPDGRWIAYVSMESGRREVYVRAVGDAAGKWQISVGGGILPAWSRDGRELFYRNSNRMMVADIAKQAVFSASRPRVLFEGTYKNSEADRYYDISPDGQRFLMVRSVGQQRANAQIEVVLNWFEELRQRVPSGKK